MKSLFLFLLVITPVANADDSRYNDVRDNVFWPKLYSNAYVTFYCGTNQDAGEKVTVEHVYPASWIADANGCPNRKECPQEPYREASSDLHNLWPALGRYNKSRGNQPFGDIPGEEPRFEGDTCDYERTSGRGAIVEPRDDIKGDIARSILYMMYSYNLPDHAILPLLVDWHIQDPPNDLERRRNDRIEELQGNRNPFID